MRILKALALSASLIVGFGAATLVAAPPAEAQAETARVTLHIDGMTCASCSLAVRTALRRLDGVREANVSFDEKRARVVYDPARVTTERMVQAINDLGYRARVEERG